MELKEVATAGMSARDGGAAIKTDTATIDEQQRSQARLRKLLHIASRYQAHTSTAHRGLKDDKQGRESNEDFYRGCHPPGDLHNRHNVDTFVVPYAYNLYNDRPKTLTASAGSLSPTSIEILNMATIHKSIRTLDELIEYYVIEYLNLGDCDIDGLYMVDRSPTDHVQMNAIDTASIMESAGAGAGVDVMYDPSCHNTTSTLCVPIRGGITVEYDANIVSKEELQEDILAAIQHGLDSDKLKPQASAIQKAVFLGPDHVAVDRTSMPQKHPNGGGDVGNNGNNGGGSPIASSKSSMLPKHGNVGNGSGGINGGANNLIANSLSNMLPSNGNSVDGGNRTSKTVGIVGGLFLVVASCLLVLRIHQRNKKSAASHQNDDYDVEEIWAQEIDDIDADEVVFHDDRVRDFV